jgi:hypothetical protein
MTKTRISALLESSLLELIPYFVKNRIGLLWQNVEKDYKSEGVKTFLFLHSLLRVQNPGLRL